jgi:hypothetical protein
LPASNSHFSRHPEYREGSPEVAGKPFFLTN